MLVTDFDGEHLIATEAELLDHLHSVRRGVYGAFILQNDTSTPSLWVLFNGRIAYLHFFPRKDHAGLGAMNMAPVGAPGTIHFRQINNCEADGFDIDIRWVVSADEAYMAAVEFFRKAEAPASVEWVEL